MEPLRMRPDEILDTSLTGTLTTPCDDVVTKEKVNPDRYNRVCRPNAKTAFDLFLSALMG